LLVYANGSREEASGVPRRVGQVKTYCAYCDDGKTLATHVLEVSVAYRAAPGTGVNRGPRVGSATRRVCQRHAEQFLKVAQRGPSGRRITA
jgi:hypothetical protein